MLFNEVTFVSMVKDKQVTLHREAVPDGEIDFLASAVRQGGAVFEDEGLELVVDRPKGSVSGEPLDGALVYLFRRVGEEEVICGGLVCWDEEWATESWEFARSLQMASDIICQAPTTPPATPWVAGFQTSNYSEVQPETAKRLGDLDQAVVFAALRGGRAGASRTQTVV